MTQRCTRYFFLLNLFGFFFLSASALAAEPIEEEGCASSTCVLSSCANVDSVSGLSLQYDLQPILGAAIARLDSDESTTDGGTPIWRADVPPARPVSTLVLAPKQSPPAFA